MDSSGSATMRYASLARLLLRYGRSDLVRGAGLDTFATEAEALEGDADTAEAFAADLERMGPTYTKLGQLLSTRFDLLPAPYTEALSRLQDEVEPFPFEQVKEIIETELGADLRNLYDHFAPTPATSSPATWRPCASSPRWPTAAPRRGGSSASPTCCASSSSR
jgi:predicted unusual protein kinase regulating ubiquinone biosynthesis (AarF/ABC1/UbiB family)